MRCIAKKVKKNDDVGNLENGLPFSVYEKLQKLNIQDANSGYTPFEHHRCGFFPMKRDKLFRLLKNPYVNFKALINLSIDLYYGNIIYRRLCDTLADMMLYSYTIAPTGNAYERTPANIAKWQKAYATVTKKLEAMNIQHNANTIARVVVREGCYYGVSISNKVSNFMLYRFPHEYCRITSFEDGVPLYALDLTYFSDKEILINSIGGELLEAYTAFKTNQKERWYEISSKISVCILADNSTLRPLPLLCGVFPDLYYLDDYKDLAKNKREIDLYKLISMKIPLDSKGNLILQNKFLTDCYDQTANQLPSQVGLSMSPCSIDTVDFDSSNSTTEDVTDKATRDLYSTAGISSFLFNNENASSSALLQSVKNMMSFVRPIMKNIESWINRCLKLQAGVNFKVVFQCVSIYTRETYIAELRKDMQYGLPVKSALATLEDIPATDLTGMMFLENNVLDIRSQLTPPATSATTTVDDIQSGRPESDMLSDSGEQTRESESNAER